MNFRLLSFSIRWFIIFNFLQNLRGVVKRNSKRNRRNVNPKTFYDTSSNLPLLQTSRQLAKASSHSPPLSPPCLTATPVFLSSLLLFVYREEFWSVEVNHMGRVRFYPNFCFPCNVIDMLFEFSKIRKNTDVNFLCLASCKCLL